MEALFRSVLRMSATGAAVICVVLLLRLLLKRAPKRCSYWLWSAAAFRLVCPVSFRSAFSVFALAPAALPAQTGVLSDLPLLPVGTAPQPTLSPAPALPSAAGTANAALSVAGTASGAVSPLSVLGWIWLAGAALLLLWGILRYLRLAKRLRTAVRLYGNVWQTDAVDAPFLMGFFRPRIYIPFGLAGERLDYVLAHERFHIARRDHLVKLLAFAILALHWFDPLVWLAFVLAGRDMEMRCDEAVLGRGAAASKAYSETLLSFAVGGRFPSPGPLAFGESGVKQRIKNALRWKAPKPWATVCAALLCVIAVAACAADPAERAQEASPEQTAPPHADATVKGPGAYTGVEGYLHSEILRTCETEGVDLIRRDGSAVRVAVPETEIVELTITGAVNDLAPEGQLQSWRYRVRLVLAEDAQDLQMTGDMKKESLRYVLYRTNDVVALAYPNDRVDILYDAPVDDDIPFFGCHESCEEAIYDWYVTENGLDLPLYVMDWGAGLSAGGSFPVRRFDGDGWYVYIPVTGWQLTESSIERCAWTSASDTGSSFAVREASAAEAAAEQEYPEGVTEAFYAARDGRYWRVTARSDPKILVYSSWVGKEPEILQHMAESFRVVGASEGFFAGPQRPEN